MIDYRFSKDFHLVRSSFARLHSGRLEQIFWLRRRYLSHSKEPFRYLNNSEAVDRRCVVIFFFGFSFSCFILFCYIVTVAISWSSKHLRSYQLKNTSVVCIGNCYKSYSQVKEKGGETFQQIAFFLQHLYLWLRANSLAVKSMKSILAQR